MKLKFCRAWFLMSKKAPRSSNDFDLATQDSELIDATQGAASVHLEWSGVVLIRPDSSLLNITFCGNIVKICGGRRHIQFRIPRSLKYALEPQLLTAVGISDIFLLQLKVWYCCYCWTPKLRPEPKANLLFMRCFHKSVIVSRQLSRSWNVHAVLHLCRRCIPRNHFHEIHID